MNADTSGPLEVVVFDLNGTFYNKSSKDEFYKFLCARQPKRVRYYLQMLWYNILLKFHQINQTEFKENFFNYLNHLPPDQVAIYAEEYWREEYPGEFNKELMAHFDALRRKNVKVVCATGALDVYVKPLFTLYEIDAVIGTKVRYTNGTYLIDGKACKGQQKIERLKALFEGRSISIIEAYSDSEEEILDEANNAFLVKDGNIRPYKNGAS